MKLARILEPLAVVLISIGCAGNSNRGSNYEYNSAEDKSVEGTEEGYADGRYCALIDYYYYKSGTNSTYTLEVEIENNELTVIHWPNGGWLDDSHFSPPDISDGDANFTSDRGIDYSVRIIGSEGDCSLDAIVVDEDELIRQDEDNERLLIEEEEERLQQEEEEEERLQQEEEEERLQQEEEERLQLEEEEQEE